MAVGFGFNDFPGKLSDGSRVFINFFKGRADLLQERLTFLNQLVGPGVKSIAQSQGLLEKGLTFPGPGRIIRQIVPGGKELG